MALGFFPSQRELGWSGTWTWGFVKDRLSGKWGTWISHVGIVTGSAVTLFSCCIFSVTPSLFMMLVMRNINCMSWHCMSTCKKLQEPQNRWGWRDLWSSSCPAAMLKAGSAGAGSSHVRLWHEYLQGWRLHNLLQCLTTLTVKKTLKLRKYLLMFK